METSYGGLEKMTDVRGNIGFSDKLCLRGCLRYARRARPCSRAWAMRRRTDLCSYPRREAAAKRVTLLLWLRESGRTPIWIGLDSYDNSLAVFSTARDRLLFIKPDNENMRGVLTDPAFSATPVGAYGKGFLSEMRPPEGLYAVVLDDFHMITSGEILKSLPLVAKGTAQLYRFLSFPRGDIPEELAPLVKMKKDIIRRNACASRKRRSGSTSICWAFFNAGRDQVRLYGNGRLGNRCERRRDVRQLGHAGGGMISHIILRLRAGTRDSELVTSVCVPPWRTNSIRSLLPRFPAARCA